MLLVHLSSISAAYLEFTNQLLLVYMSTCAREQQEASQCMNSTITGLIVIQNIVQ